MNGWHLIPFTIQYLIAGSVALALAFYVLHKNRGTIAAKFFANFAVFLALWQFFMFFHRNAPTMSLSKIFFALGTGFASLMLPALFLTVTFLQDGNKKYLIVMVPNLVFFVFLLLQIPFDVFWTDFGWSYAFRPEMSSYVFLPLTVFYVTLNYIWMIRPIRESKVPIIRKKYKFILFGFTVLFIIGVVVYNTLLLPVIPNAPPIGGVVVSVGLFLITHGILLKEKMEETQLSIPHGKISEKTSIFLQKFFNSIYEGGLGQRPLKFERYLKETSLIEDVNFVGGKVVLLKEPSTSQLVKILDVALNYLEKEDVSDKIVPELIELWNILYPLIESDTISLIKAHEGYIRGNNLIHEIANGRFRSLFLPRGFTEKDLDAFSRHLGIAHKELFGNPVLVEFNPSERYERKIETYIHEVLANNEELAVFSRRGSRIITLLPTERVHVFYLSPILSRRNMISDYEVELPLYDLTHLLGEIRLAAKRRYSILVDNLTDLVFSIGFEKAYMFTRNAVEFVASFGVPALFLIAEGHKHEVKVAFENLFPMILKIGEKRSIRIK